MIAFLEHISASAINFFSFVGAVMVFTACIVIVLSGIQIVVKAWPRRSDTHNHFHTPTSVVRSGDQEVSTPK